MVVVEIQSSGRSLEAVQTVDLLYVVSKVVQDNAVDRCRNYMAGKCGSWNSTGIREAEQIVRIVNMVPRMIQGNVLAVEAVETVEEL